MEFKRISKRFIYYAKGSREEYPGEVAASADAFFLFYRRSRDASILDHVLSSPPLGGSRLAYDNADLVAKKLARPIGEVPDEFLLQGTWPLPTRKGCIVILSKSTIKKVYYTLFGGLELRCGEFDFRVELSAFSQKSVVQWLGDHGWSIHKGKDEKPAE